MKNVTKYITPDAVEEIKNAIFEANGNEVFLVGKLNSDNIVEEIMLLARGNEFAVPLVQRNLEFGDVVIHNHPSGNLNPSENDMDIAFHLGKIGIASFIVNNEVDDIYAVIEPVKKKKTQLLNSALISAIINPDGPIAEKLPDYEFRPQQLQMIEQVCEAFNQNQICIIEAGTGIGKTLSYLLPAIYWTVQNNERCTVSTNTINLQEQLINKDIPFLQSVLNLKFSAVLVKGRNNYACMRKIADIERQPDLLVAPEEMSEIQTLINWSKVTTDGSKSDLNFIPKELIWEKIAAEGDNCLHAQCAFFKKCFVNVARKAANSAQIIVVNHYLLFADLAVRAQGVETAVLPSYKRLILDEAHHIEDVATNYFGSSITKAGINRMLGRLYRPRKDDKVTGFFILLLHELKKMKSENITDENIDKVIAVVEQKLIPKINHLVNSNNEVMDQLVDLISTRNTNGFGEIKQRVTPVFKQNPLWKMSINDKMSEFLFQIKQFSQESAKIVDILLNSELSLNEDLLSNIAEISAQIERLLTASGTIDQVLFTEDEENIRWLEVQQKSSGKITRLKISPLDVASTMKKKLYDRFKTIVMTSATLTVSGMNDQDAFGFFANRIGLYQIENKRIHKTILKAPFDYQKQAIVCIPIDIPAPDQSGFSDRLAELIETSISISDGRAFILFTSYSLLNSIYTRLENKLLKQGILALKQGTENRHQLLQKFMRDKTSVLFATDSFWEGVDVRGEALESVIITKLPFKVPTEPVVEARVEAIRKNGGNPFMEYSLPQAVIKLKQGFGRLIRSKTDRGSILIFDKRIVEKEYGKIFVASLPDCDTVRGTQDIVFKRLKTFYENYRQ